MTTNLGAQNNTELFCHSSRGQKFKIRWQDFVPPFPFLSQLQEAACISWLMSPSIITSPSPTLILLFPPHIRTLVIILGLSR